MLELDEMTNLTAFLKGNNLTKLLVTGRPLLDFIQREEKNHLWTLGFED